MSRSWLSLGLRHLPQVFVPCLRRPVYWVHFVTHRCTARCLHCFVERDRQPLASGPELSVGEIERVARSLSRTVDAVLLTGGEPFARDDMGDILKVYLAHTQARIRIATNGWQTERIVQCAQHVTGPSARARLAFVVSLDGPQPVHDRIRGVPGSFDRACATYRELRRLRDHQNGPAVGVNLTVSAFNQWDLTAFAREFVAGSDPDLVSVTLTRGSPRHPAAADVSAQAYADLIGALEEHPLGASPLARLIEAQDIIARRQILRHLRGARLRGRCFAGSLSGVLDADGSVYACELLPQPMGNVREHDGDALRLWGAAPAHAVRRHIAQARCWCTHECTKTVNILFSPRYWPRLLSLTWRLRRARGRVSSAPARPVRAASP